MTTSWRWSRAKRRWRAMLLEALQPRDGELIVDIGCGTGSQAIAIKIGAVLERAVVGVDPDPAVLAIARAKAAAPASRSSGFNVWAARRSELVGARAADAVISSLVLHQCDVPVKGEILEAMARLAKPGRAGPDRRLRPPAWG
jgi:ubiquinone/menaquinone biosynthesis C-methylase UbiE